MLLPHARAMCQRFGRHLNFLYAVIDCLAWEHLFEFKVVSRMAFHVDLDLQDERYEVFPSRVEDGSVDPWYPRRPSLPGVVPSITPPPSALPLPSTSYSTDPDTGECMTQ
jgi:hypothetical protein